jgi:hypothetical protein
MAPYHIIRYQAEEAKTRGTPVTRESFLAWKVKFDKETAAKKAKEQEEKLKNLTPKEREEHKKFQGRLSGTIIFLSIPSPSLKRSQASNFLKGAETGARMSRLRKTELLSMSPNMSAPAKRRRNTKGIVSISAIAIKTGNADEWWRVWCVDNARYYRCDDV